MTLTRRNFVIGAAAASLAAGTDEAGATTSAASAKAAAAYFGPIVEDNGIQFRSTMFAKINHQVAPAVRALYQHRAAGHGGDRCHQSLPLCDLREPDGATLWRRRRPRRLPLVWPRPHRPQATVAALDAAAGDASAASGTAGIYGRRREQPARTARHVPVPTGQGSLAIASTARVEPWSIGTNASSGCIRMFNEDAIDLYQRCPIGTRVLVLKVLGAPVMNKSAAVDGQ